MCLVHEVPGSAALLQPSTDSTRLTPLESRQGHKSEASRRKQPEGGLPTLLCPAIISNLRLMERISYFSWDAVFSRKRYHLPHILQKDAVYFVTMRLIDSIPQAKLQFWRSQFERWAAANPPPHTPEQIESAKDMTVRRTERYLDDGHGCCVLRDPECRQPLIEACSTATASTMHWAITR